MNQEQLAFLSAARRHSRDAEELLHKSPDQAWHLAGFGPECIRKACLHDNALYRAIGHDFGEFSEPLLDLALSLDPLACRYDLLGWARQLPQLLTWRPEHRYDKTGTHTLVETTPFVLASARLVERVYADLWADGRIPSKEQ